MIAELASTELNTNLRGLWGNCRISFYSITITLLEADMRERAINGEGMNE